MTVGEVIDSYAGVSSHDAFHYWLMSSNIGNPEQRIRLAERMNREYKANRDWWSTQDTERLYESAQW